MQGFNEHASLNEDEVNALNILLRGAALNAVEIAETLIKNNFYGK